MKKIAPSFGSENYPHQGRGERIGVTSFRRCRICNSPNDTRSTGWAKKGEGLAQISGAISGDFQASGGCWFCGSKLWLKEKPAKLPDDRFLPNPKGSTDHGPRRS